MEKQTTKRQTANENAAISDCERLSEPTPQLQADPEKWTEEQFEEAINILANHLALGGLGKLGHSNRVRSLSEEAKSEKRKGLQAESNILAWN